MNFNNKIKGGCVDYSSHPERMPKFLHNFESMYKSFTGLRLKPSLIVDMILVPERFWQRVKISDSRTTYSPNQELRRVQRKIFRWTLPRLSPSSWYTVIESIVENALSHTKNKSSLVIDLEKAYESVTRRQLERYLTNRGLGKKRAWIVSRILTFKGRLQRGSPISSRVFSMMIERTENQIKAVIGKNVVFSRYGDDLCFSSPEPQFPKEEKEKVLKVIAKHGHRVNFRKTTEGKNRILIFPGVVVVNGRIQPRRSYMTKLKDRYNNRELTDEQINGHFWFIHQFPRSGQRAVFREAPFIGSLKPVLNPTNKKPAPRYSRYEGLPL